MNRLSFIWNRALSRFPKRKGSKLTNVQKIKTHALSITVILTLCFLIIQTKSGVQYIRHRFQDNTFKFHQEMDDFMDNKLIKIERNQGNTNPNKNM